MQIQIFNVVELINGEKAIIKGKEKNSYKVEIINENEKLNNLKEIKEEDIKKILYKK